MTGQNSPYRSETSEPHENGSPTLRGKIGLLVLGVGLVVLAYGAVAFWVMPSLPPNGGASGRLPSLYLMGGGIVSVVLGLAIRGLNTNGQGDTQKTGKGSVSPLVGILILFAILAAFIGVVSQM